MNIEQDTTEFNPITITLQTRLEVESFWQIILSAEKNGVLVGEQKKIATKISNFFTNSAHL